MADLVGSAGRGFMSVGPVIVRNVAQAKRLRCKYLDTVRLNGYMRLEKPYKCRE